MVTVECACGQVFMAEAGETECPWCAGAADRLHCKACKTQLLREVPNQLCGICDPAWTESVAA